MVFPTCLLVAVDLFSQISPVNGPQAAFNEVHLLTRELVEFLQLDYNV